MPAGGENAKTPAEEDERSPGAAGGSPELSGEMKTEGGAPSPAPDRRQLEGGAIAVPRLEVDSMRRASTTLPPASEFDPEEATGEDVRPPIGEATEPDTGETGLEDSPTDQGPSEEDTYGAMSSAIDQPTAPLSLDKIREPELPRRADKRSPTDLRRVAPDPEAGQMIGGYELVQKLGKGGAGAVFRARRTSDGEIVALKVLAASKVKRARIVQRFFDEVRAASTVAHPGLIRIIDFIEEEDPRRLAYAMEYVDGETLRDRVKRDGALDLREAIHIGIEVSDALTALHDAGIIHRDLKPENIMLLRTLGAMPRVKLLDFGVVKFLPIDRSGGSAIADVGAERPGTFVGTPRYMAPEQAAGGVVDPRSDLFAVGVLLFEMITGGCPHEGESLRDVVMAKLKGAPRIKMNPGKEILPQELTEIVDACLQLKPALRPKSARDVGLALKEAVAVLFVVGPVKADDTGALFRPSQSSPPMPLSALDGGATDPVMPRLPTPIPVGVLPGPALPAGSKDQAPPKTTAAPSGPQAPERMAVKKPRTIAIVVLVFVVLAIGLVLLGIKLAHPDEMLLVPLEAPAVDGKPEPKLRPAPSPEPAPEPTE